MVPSLREPLELEQDESPVASVASAASRRRRPLVSDGGMRKPRTASAVWPVLAALVAGSVVAVLILAASLRSEFPLYSEASAARGRDCATIASARHALDAALEAHLPLRAEDADAVRDIRSAVAAFAARTQDLATPAVDSALNPVRGGLDALSDSVLRYAASPYSTSADATVDAAFQGVREAWKGSIARVCS
ncbi:transporter [Leifsonia sp. LS-T14]|uniref:transporter n=1 Tax=unclassified Leifsonia TaxID=2663824 RepID=UPI0035A5F5F9